MICKDIILKNDKGEYFLYINKKKELVFQKIKNNSLCSEIEIVMLFCTDFDAIMDRTGKIHIVGCEESGALLYFQRAGQHWAKGKISEAKAENVFLFKANENLVVFFLEKSYIKCFDFSDVEGGAFEIDRISEDKEYHITPSNENDFYIFYTKAEKENFGFKRFSAEKRECDNFEDISKGADIKNIFALTLNDDVLLSYKEDDAIKFEKIGEKTGKESLTRRHGGSAQCPIIMRSQDGVKLCWLDGRSIFSSIRTFKEERWQRLEREDFKEFETLNIFKLCSSEDCEYVLGGLKNNKVVIWERSEKINEICREKSISYELSEIRRTVEEINKKIDKISGWSNEKGLLK